VAQTVFIFVALESPIIGCHNAHGCTLQTFGFILKDSERPKIKIKTFFRQLLSGLLP
jgi:hypothetical protein